MLPLKNTLFYRFREKIPAVAVAWFCCWLLLLPVTESVRADSSPEVVTKELERINSRIQALNRKKLEQEGEAGKLKLKLKMLDKQVARNLRALKKLNQRIATANDKLASLRERLQLESAELTHHRNLLAQHLRAMYRTPDRLRLQALMRPGSVADAQLNQAFYGYLQAARAERLKVISGRLARLDDTQRDLKQELEKLKKLKSKAEATRKALKKDKLTRSRTIARINKQLKSSQEKLKSLAADRAQLNELLERLRFAAANPGMLDKDKQGFAALRGSLNWPLKGLVQKTGSTPGVTVIAPAGEKVHAVASGTVVFADWMRGFGLLIIIDHGGGYMSLYGRNQRLFKAPGDKV
jgi:septal ring factor EnvC (AmiA/AmiB activator)